MRRFDEAKSKLSLTDKNLKDYALATCLRILVTSVDMVRMVRGNLGRD